LAGEWLFGTIVALVFAAGGAWFLRGWLTRERTDPRSD
jgi:hypothetical protein